MRFASIDDMVSTERACVYTLGGLLNDAQFEVLLREAQQALRPFTDEEEKVIFSMPALILTTVKRSA